jgi:predicted nucleic acid-binding protein
MPTSTMTTKHLTVQRIAVDANVFVSYLTGRHEKQYDAARARLQEATA